MDSSVAAHALARASATLIGGNDVPGTLVALLKECQDALRVDTVGILIETAGHLELLSASSHAASELEIHQAQVDEGPCVHAHASGAPVAVAGAAELRQAWPIFGATMVDAGFGAVHASPIRWRRSTIGAMGLFRRSEEPFAADDDTFAQAFADIVACLVIGSDEFTAEEITRRLDAALATRVVIEQAKGVLAELHDVDMGEAYEMLVQASIDQDTPLADWSARVVREAGPTR
jgi:hypothetical protein